MNSWNFRRSFSISRLWKGKGVRPEKRPFGKNPGGQEMEYRLFSFVVDRMAGVVAPLVAYHHVKITGKVIDCFTFAFVTPL